jgi:hypothetical protein
MSESFVALGGKATSKAQILLAVPCMKISDEQVGSVILFMSSALTTAKTERHLITCLFILVANYFTSIVRCIQIVSPLLSCKTSALGRIFRIPFRGLILQEYVSR